MSSVLASGSEASASAVSEPGTLIRPVSGEGAASAAAAYPCRSAIRASAGYDQLTEAIQVAREINGKSPTAQRMLKFAFNLVDDGLMGQQVFAGEATRLAYMTDEAVEGRDSFLEKRPPNWEEFPFYY